MSEKILADSFITAFIGRSFWAARGWARESEGRTLGDRRGRKELEGRAWEGGREREKAYRS